MLPVIFLIVLLSILTEACVELLTKSAFFGFLREYIDKKAEVSKGVVGAVYSFVHKVVHCPYCCSVWAALFSVCLVVLAAVFSGFSFVITGNLGVDLFILLVVVHRLSNFIHYVGDWLYKLKQAD